MPITMGVKIEGLNTLHEKMKKWPALQKKHVRKGIGKVGQQMVREWKISVSGPRGPRKVAPRSGDMRRRISARFVPGHYAAVDVGMGVPYGPVHEFGFDGIVNVRAHTREGSSVRAHSRHMRMPKRPHMRPAVRATQKRMPTILRNQYRDFLRELNRIRRPD